MKTRTHFAHRIDMLDPAGLRLRLHVVRNHEPAAVNFLVDVRDDVVGLGIFAVLHFWCPALLTHLPRQVAIDVNVLV